MAPALEEDGVVKAAEEVIAMEAISSKNLHQATNHIMGNEKNFQVIAETRTIPLGVDSMIRTLQGMNDLIEDHLQIGNGCAQIRTHLWEVPIAETMIVMVEDMENPLPTTEWYSEKKGEVCVVTVGHQSIQCIESLDLRLTQRPHQDSHRRGVEEALEEVIVDVLPVSEAQYDHLTPSPLAPPGHLPLL